MAKGRSTRGAGGLPGEQARVLGWATPNRPIRCTAKHEVPWSERCILAPNHSGDHLDKAGRTWA